jgi:hypothetical protein
MANEPIEPTSRIEELLLRRDSVVEDFTVPELMARGLFVKALMNAKDETLVDTLRTVITEIGARVARPNGDTVNQSYEMINHGIMRTLELVTESMKGAF